MGLTSEPVVSTEAGHEDDEHMENLSHVFSWGNGQFGALGHGDKEHCFSPMQIEALTGMSIRCIDAGDKHAVAATVAAVYVPEKTPARLSPCSFVCPELTRKKICSI